MNLNIQLLVSYIICLSSMCECIVCNSTIYMLNDHWSNFYCKFYYVLLYYLYAFISSATSR